MHTRRAFLRRAAAAGIAGAGIARYAGAAPEATAERPNIVYILADDLGYGDVGCYGQEKILTPRIDRMAGEGLKFTDHYAGSTVCAPSRCVLMTGLHSGHALVRANGRVPLRPGDVTVAEVLRRAGYATGMVGKWGLGEAGSTGEPNRQGFDHFFGYLNQGRAHFYYPPYLWRNTEKVPLAGNAGDKQETYSHDLLAEEALGLIRRWKDRRFFLYVPFTIPHAEVTVPEDSMKPYRGTWEEKPYKGGHYCAQAEPRAARAGMISRMDRDVGRILDLLEELGLDKRTVVMFTSDNGPCGAGGQDYRFFESGGGLRGTKRTLYEGGIRVPMIARWPGRIEAGTTTDLASAFWDVLPTCAELAGVEPGTETDGISFVPTLVGRPGKQKAHDHLYWEYKGWQAVRLGRWKAVRRAPGKATELYDLAADVDESEDIAADHPDIVARAEKLFTSARTPSSKFPLRRKRK